MACKPKTEQAQAQGRAAGCGPADSRLAEITRPRRVEIVAKERVFDGFFKIDQAKVRYEKFSGEMSQPVNRLSFERGDAVAAILFNPVTRKVVVVNQFRYPTCGWVLEVAAGMLEEGEEPEEAMRREILEETGYQVDHLEPIYTFYVSPGGSSERILLFFAQVSERVAEGGGVEGESEDIQVCELDVDEYLALLDSGALNDAKTIIATLWLKNRLQQAP